MTAAVLKAQWPAPPRVQAWVTQRAGGVSAGAYASLNLAARVGDAPERVAENRRRLARRLALPGEPCWLEQMHSATVLDLDTQGAGRADGAVTARAGVVCAVLSADCLPVLLCERAGARIGIAHAGWRGLAGGVLGNAVAAMGVNAGELLAWLGPAIGAAAYEVGAEVRAAFVERDRRAQACFEPNARGRWQADLYALARLALEAAGVGAIYGGGFCTFSEARFFSHRRQAPCGRMASLIWIEQ